MSSQLIPQLEGTRIIPLFPLPVVLYPGAMLPLHIFEERYKAMMQDCLEGDKIFGVTYTDGREGWPPPLDRLGCAAFTLATVPLAEGRMNILTTGVSRYRVLNYIQEKAYLEGEVEFLQDDPTGDDLTDLTDSLESIFKRVVQATRTINNSEAEDDDLPDSPEALSFSIAATLQLPDSQKLELLEMTNTRRRLERLKSLLQSVVGKYEMRAYVHEKAKTNGHGPHKTLDRFEDGSIETVDDEDDE